MEKLNTHQATLLQNLLKGPLPYNALSRDVIALIDHIGSVEEHGREKLLFSVGSARRTFLRPKGKHMTEQELSELRHFLLASQTDVQEEEIGEAGASIVVIDHHKAQIFRAANGSRPEFITKTAPYDPHGFHRHLIHRKQASYIGDRVPEDPAFYGDIAQVLKTASSVVVIGHGSGKSNAAAYLVEYLQKNFPDIADRIAGTEAADLSALTEPQIEALAEQYLKRGAESGSNFIRS